MVGVSMLMVMQEKSTTVEDFKQAIVNIGLDLGANYTLAILHNFQLIGNVGFNSTKMGWFEGGGITAGVGFRVQSLLWQCSLSVVKKIFRRFGAN
ncbi:MAG: hypothetical protein LBB79_06950 [Prevotellaceae bacterium]|jgi:hypothetical protein|nr:hypothetical protein [Prevotellaceae bacterium]